VAVRKRLARFAEKFQAVQKVTHGFSNGAPGRALDVRCAAVFSLGAGQALEHSLEGGAGPD
jgi:hypothetical protein